MTAVPKDVVGATSKASWDDAKILKAVHEEILRREDDLKELSLHMFDNPELAFKEVKAHDLLTAYLEKEGFEVERNFHLPTAFRAVFEYGSGGRTYGLNSELDALPEIGHACGHPLIAVAGIATLLGLRHVMREYDIPGKVVLLGTPAEEAGAGKVDLIGAGAYEGMDACMMVHPGQCDVGFTDIGPTLAIQGFDVEYFGKTAHAAGAPWEGINALDAVNLAYSAINAVRQQLKPSDRVHGIILNGGEAQNIIPGYASMRYGARATTLKELERVKSKILPCFEAAAKATGCTYKVTHSRTIYDNRNCQPIGRVFGDSLSELFGMTTTARYHDWSQGGLSTDFGNVTYAVPACHPFYGVPTQSEGQNHTLAFEKSCREDESHRETWKVATGMAAVGLKILRDDEFAAEVKSWWERDIRGEFTK